LAPIANRTRSSFAVQAGRSLGSPHAEIESGDGVHRGFVEPAHEEVEPAVVVVVEEPGGKAVSRFSDAGDRGHVSEPRAVVAEQQIGLAETRHVQVEAPVVVEIAPGHAFDHAQHAETERGRAIGKSAVAVVVKKLHRVPRGPSAPVLVADEQIEKSVVVVVAPRRRVRRMEGQQSSGLRDVLEGAVSLVAQQRLGMQPGLS